MASTFKDSMSYSKLVRHAHGALIEYLIAPRFYRQKRIFGLFIASASTL